MEHLVGSHDEVGWVVLKALLLYLTAVLGLRLGERRTLAQLSPFDFVAAVAVGAIVGRVPNAHDGSYLTGFATLATVLVAHSAVTRLRLHVGAARLLEHRPRLLVAEGRVLEDELRRCGLTRGDLDLLLRQHGVEELRLVRHLIFEPRGQVSIVRATAAAP